MMRIATTTRWALWVGAVSTMSRAFQARPSFAVHRSLTGFRAGSTGTTRSISAVSPTILNPPTSSSGDATDSEDWQKILNVAEDAARQAGKIMMETTGQISVLDFKSNVRDMVTASDVACQKTIKEVILEAFPDHGFLGEEDVAAGSEASADALKAALAKQTSDILWVVDPIDGTTNFQAGVLFVAMDTVDAPSFTVTFAFRLHDSMVLLVGLG